MLAEVLLVWQSRVEEDVLEDLENPEVAFSLNLAVFAAVSQGGWDFRSKHSKEDLKILAFSRP